jgi:hypothetical protein
MIGKLDGLVGRRWRWTIDGPIYENVPFAPNAREGLGSLPLNRLGGQRDPLFHRHQERPPSPVGQKVRVAKGAMVDKNERNRPTIVETGSIHMIFGRETIAPAKSGRRWIGAREEPWPKTLTRTFGWGSHPSNKKAFESMCRHALCVGFSSIKHKSPFNACAGACPVGHVGACTRTKCAQGKRPQINKYPSQRLANSTQNQAGGPLFFLPCNRSMVETNLFRDRGSYVFHDRKTMETAGRRRCNPGSMVVEETSHTPDVR